MHGPVESLRRRHLELLVEGRQCSKRTFEPPRLAIAAGAGRVGWEAASSRMTWDPIVIWWRGGSLSPVKVPRWLREVHTGRVLVECA